LKEYPAAMSRLIEEFAKLPGVGQKSAERMAFHILRSSEEDAMALARAISDVKHKMKQCSVCFNIADSDPCSICSDPRRDHSVVCVVEEPKDMIALERVGSYNGLYHVLMGRIAPLDGMEPDDLTIKQLVERVERGGIKEVIIATNPTVEGDGTALYIAEQLKGKGVKVTRIAKGVPTGSNLEYVNAAILADALSGRREMK